MTFFSDSHFSVFHWLCSCFIFCWTSTIVEVQQNICPGWCIRTAGVAAYAQHSLCYPAIWSFGRESMLTPSLSATCTHKKARAAGFSIAFTKYFLLVKNRTTCTSTLRQRYLNLWTAHHHKYAFGNVRSAKASTKISCSYQKDTLYQCLVTVNAGELFTLSRLLGP